MASRSLNRLSAVLVAKTTIVGRHSDGGGLYLFISNEGRRRWIFMYTRHGKRFELGLGSSRDVSLATARSLASGLRTLLATGGDPKSARAKAASVPTFGKCADDFIEAMSNSWKNPKHAQQWKLALAKQAKPLRSLPVDKVTTQEIVAVLRPIWDRTPETAERLRGRVERVLSAAKAKGHRTGENPATWKGHLDQLLPPRRRLSRGHHPALKYQDVGAFVSNLRTREAVASDALEFTILTAARSGETLGMTWAEVDLADKRWTVPADRMKAGREHRVPLVPRALEILKKQKIGKPEEYVFRRSGTDKPLSSMSMAMLLRRMEVDVTVHGFRSTFRDWASETTGFPHEICEMALAHTISNKAEAAYRRGDLFEKRRGLMSAWADHLATRAPASVKRKNARNAVK